MELVLEQVLSRYFVDTVSFEVEYQEFALLALEGMVQVCFAPLMVEEVVAVA